MPIGLGLLTAHGSVKLQFEVEELPPPNRNAVRIPGVGKFLSQETRDIKRFQNRGRRKFQRTEEESAKLQMERPRADVLAPRQHKIPGR